MRRFLRMAVVFLTAVLLFSLFAVYTLYCQRTSQPDPGQTTAQPAADQTTGSLDTTAAPETTAAVETTEAPTLPPDVEITAIHAIVADGESGRTLFEKTNGDPRIYPASVTKLFTAYVALQYLGENDSAVAGDELQFVAADASQAYIYRGQRVSVPMLIEGMLLCSGNDAAYILAAAGGRRIAGDDSLSAATAVQVFVDEMNAQAQALGLTGTHFMNPDGYHAEGHYSSLGDLVKIGQLAMRDPVIARYVAMAQDEDVVYLSGETNSWKNTNLLLHPDSEFYSPSACGLKTGHTDEGGYCLLSAFRQGDEYLIVGVFGCPTSDDRFRDSLILAREIGGITDGTVSISGSEPS